MGCRKYRGRQYFDDLTQETHLPEELEEFAFVFDGQALELDLDDENAEAFRQAMAPFVAAARPTTKSKVLATLPRKRRHLTVVPDVSPSPEPEGVPQNAPETEKGDDVETRTEPEGTQVPETAPNASNSRVPTPAERPVSPLIPKDWASMAPRTTDDKPTRVKRCRAWATTTGTRAQHETLTDEVFDRWEKFYRDREWSRL